eukprot:CAMPEP_0184748832 /NCGR_PEP_ID=MMETSP0315-20130426/23126_1 /TAXON_ID=101924 /ORGANISM="Rhodosorus marinus, Strain UTEX LB 2760" /LENGTH=64 /DNA_ID=CAMNT_0027224835 /DNA_START=51 /DNA_END=242 /DNA_ORIENTATION=+
MTSLDMKRKAFFAGVSGIILILLVLILRGHRAPDWEQGPPAADDEQAMVIELAGGEFVEFRRSD